MCQSSVTGGGPLCTADAPVLSGIHMFSVWELPGLVQALFFWEDGCFIIQRDAGMKEFFFGHWVSFFWAPLLVRHRGRGVALTPGRLPVEFR